MKIHVITGSTGEYDEHQEWMVVAFLDKVQAEEHISRLKAWLSGDDVPHRRRSRKPTDFSLDPQLEGYWRDEDVEYGINEVELLDNIVAT